MVNTCPNCSHPLRPGAKFCGYCGTDLFDVGDRSGEELQGNSIAGLDSKARRGAKVGRKDPFKTASIIAIILMILIILAAVTWQYWAYVAPVINQLLPGLFIK